MGEWKRLDRTSIGARMWDQTYADGEACLVCSCGCEVYLDAQGGQTKCECGRRFQVVVRIEELIKEDTDD